MNTDIRLLLSFRHHPKTKKLRLKLGEGGVLGFVWLMFFAAESRPEGVLEDMDAEDIALAADYRGDPQEFVETLLAVRFLDFDGKTYSIHNWEERNPWAAGAKQRSEHSRRAAEKRWKKEKGRTIDRPTKNQSLSPKSDAPGINGHCTGHEGAMHSAQKGNAPSPSPSLNSFVGNAVVTGRPTKRARAERDDGGENQEKDFSDWRPPEEVIARIRANHPDIPISFIDEAVPEFITYAEDHYRNNQLRAKFISRINTLWKREQLGENKHSEKQPDRKRSVADRQREASDRKRQELIHDH